ncbi:MAG: hypothetical protein ACRDU0_01525 [Mycobacterium sp.]
MAIQNSQGQQVATLTGNTGSYGASGDSTSGHGYNAGTIRILTGAAPGDADAAETGTNLVDVTLPNPMFGAASAALPSVLTANAITAATILATGTAGYGRMKANGDDGLSSTTERRVQFAVGTSGSDMNFNSLSLVSGGSLTITSLTITHPA